MDFNFLPNEFALALKNANITELYEIRLRSGFAVMGNIRGIKKYLTGNGFSSKNSNAIICNQHHIDSIISNLTEYSLYAYNDKLKQGFLTTKDGIRVGICGECVVEDEKIVTIKNFSSLNIRIPHSIKNCASDILPYVYNDTTIYNSLIIAPPTRGKTTMLKDLILKFNQLNTKSILVVDERGEFSEIVGENIDNIKYCDKLYAFTYALRSLAPDIVVTDELSSQNDWLCAKNATNSGVKIIASCHGQNIQDVLNKKHFINNVFDRYFILQPKGQVGVLNNVYDKDFKLI